jgi:hypothetical protein
MASRGITGENPLNPRGLAEDLVTTGRSRGAVGADLGSAAHHGPGVRTFSGERPPPSSVGEPISLDDAREAASRNGIDMRAIELRHEGGHPPDRYGFMSQTGGGEIFRAPNGRFEVTLTDSGLASRPDAVNTIAHEVNHIREILHNGGTGGRGYMIDSEAPATRAGDLAEQHYRGPR